MPYRADSPLRASQNRLRIRAGSVALLAVDTDGASPRRCSGSTPQETAGMRFRLCERWVSSSCSYPDSVLISECSLNLKSNACNKPLPVIPLFIRAELTTHQAETRSPPDRGVHDRGSARACCQCERTRSSIPASLLSNRPQMRRTACILYTGGLLLQKKHDP